MNTKTINREISIRLGATAIAAVEKIVAVDEDPCEIVKAVASRINVIGDALDFERGVDYCDIAALYFVLHKIIAAAPDDKGKRLGEAFLRITREDA